MAKSKKKFYVVWVGKTPGVYDSWKDCQAQISGFPYAKYKSFSTLMEAKKAFGSTYDQFYSSTPKNEKKTLDYTLYKDEIILESIAVDAACSGNPGKMEYQGVQTKNKDLIFKQGPFDQGTNNIGEFLALVHGLAYLKKEGSDRLLYTDSRIAMGWVRKKKCGTKLVPHFSNKILFELISRAESWLRSNTYSTSILKWETKAWGEIPADFGRK